MAKSEKMHVAVRVDAVILPRSDTRASLLSVLLSGALLLSGCGRSHDVGVAAADASAGQDGIVPAGWEGPQRTSLHDTMTECIVHDRVVSSCPPHFPKRMVGSASDAGANPYVYAQPGAPVTRMRFGKCG